MEKYYLNRWAKKIDRNKIFCLKKRYILYSISDISASLSGLVKSKSVSGTTSAFGQIGTNLSLSKKIICVDAGKSNTIGFPYNNSSAWAITFRDLSDFSAYVGSISATVYYID